MKLNVISYSMVRDALERRSRKWNEEQTDSFNSSFHAEAEIESVVPNPVYPHVYPDLHTEKLGNWLPIIASSQHIKRYHTIDLSLQCTDRLLGASKIWAYKARLSSSTLEDLLAFFPRQVTTITPSDADTVPSTIRQSLDGVLSQGDYFCRLDSCSPKDGGGPEIPRRAEDIIVRLVSSKRACRALEQTSPAENASFKRLYLLPFRFDMDSHREYRVWCPPGSGMWKIAAISQYRWHSPFQGKAESDETVQHTAQRVTQGATQLHRMIVKHAEGLRDGDGPVTRIRGHLEREGFTFDVFDTGEEVQLIEVNPFGAMSGCGSCLFHWIKDGRVLYGLEEEAEFRIAADVTET